MPNSKGFYPLLVIVLIALVIGSVFLFSGSGPNLFSRLSDRLTAMVVSIFDDLRPNITGGHIELINDPLLSYQSNSALKFSFPDGWHTVSYLDLYEMGTTKWASTDTFNFYIRTATTTYQESLYVALQYSGVADASQWIDIRPYLASGQATFAYKLVSIPRSAFQGSFTGAFRRFHLKVPTNQPPIFFYVDKIFLDIKNATTTPTIPPTTSTSTSTSTTATTTTATTTQIILFDDLPSNLVLHGIKAVNNSTLAHSGSWLFEVTQGNVWKTGGAWLEFTPVTLGSTDKIEFYLRTKQGTYTSPLYIWLSNGAQSSQPIDLRPYLSSGQATSVYKLVSIPRSAFQGTFQGTFQRFSISSMGTKSQTTFYLDDLNFINQILTPPIIPCTPNWLTGPWSACVNGVQTRTVTDANNCGVTTNKPATSQSCTSTPPITTASPAGGTYPTAQNVTLVANEPAIIYYCLGVSCSPNLTYSSSSPINISNSQTLCYYARDLVGNTESVKTAVYVITCTENWTCGNWSACSGGTQTRTCTDANACGTTINRPALSQSCSTPSPTTGTIIFDENDDLDLAYNVPLDMNDPLSVHSKIGLITNPALAYSGTKSLLVGPRARLNLNAATFLDNDALEFWIRTTSGTYSEATDGSYDIKLVYGGTSNYTSVSIWPYINDRQITTQYKRVLIPRTDLPQQSKPELLEGTFRMIYFQIPTGKTSTFYIDNIALVDTQGPLIENIEVLDSKHLMLTFNEKLNFADAKNITKYTVSEAANPAATLQINSAGLRVWVTGFDNISTSPNIKHYVYLNLNQEIQSGKIYKLDTTLTDLSGHPTRNSGVEFSFNFENEISSSIKINQVGYLPRSPKKVYVGNYLGDAGEMHLTPNLPVYIKDKATQRTVYQGVLQKALENDIFMVNADHRAFSGEEVWYFDFSGFETPGDYYAQIPGIGRSYDFQIGAAVFNDVFYKTARALYYQRSGITLDSAHAGQWARPSDASSLDGYYHNSVKQVGIDVSPLYNSSIEPAIGGYLDLSGGWFDAADYNKYIDSASISVDYFLTIFEIAPGKFIDNQLNIPESGNGVPDILDEAKWELDFIVKMVSANGAVFNKVTHPNFYNASGGMPADDLRNMWAITKTTRDTALACAILAKAARVLQPYFPEAARVYKEKALLAWQILQDHPDMYPNPLTLAYTNPAGDPIQGIPSISTGQGALYPNVLNDVTERAWAAIELYALTGNEAYHQKFKELKPLNTLSNWMVENYTYTPDNIKHGFDYLKIPTADPAMKTQILDGMRRVMNVFDRNEAQWRYRVAEKHITNVNFGTLAESTRYSFYYILYYYLTGNEYYLDKAKLNLDFQLGANPLSTTFITGVGSKYPLQPMSNIDDSDGIVEPIPGWSVFGPANSLPGTGYYVAFLNNAYPAYYGDYAYPVARKYQDNSRVVKYGEGGINDLTRTAAVFGYFSKPY